MTKTILLLRNAYYVLSQAQKEARLALMLPLSIKQALVGQLLGDASASKSSETANTRLTWSFGSAFLAYAEYLHDLFSLYSNTGVYSVKVLSKGVTITNYRFKTVSLALFNELFSLFYVLDTKTNRYIKVVPECIQELMSPITLAHLIMGDGNYQADRSLVRIYTNSFTYDDCVRLAVAISSMGIDAQVKLDRVSKSGVNQYILTIGTSQLEKLRILVLPHMHSSMLYRIGIV